MPLLDNGSIVRWENNIFQLGTGTTSAQESTWQYVVGLGTSAHSVELAAQMGCAYLVNGSVVCWGKDEWGLFGNDVASAYGTPRYGRTASEFVNFGVGRTAASLSMNFRHACAVLDNGDLTCWARNHKSQLGLGNTTQQYQPVVVSNVTSLRQLAVHEMPWTLPTTISGQHGVHHCTNLVQVLTMLAMLIRGPPVSL